MWVNRQLCQKLKEEFHREDIPQAKESNKVHVLKSLPEPSIACEGGSLFKLFL